MVISAEVRIWGTLVGAVLWDENLQLASFTYAQSFLATKWDLSPMKMPLQSGIQNYVFPELQSKRNSTLNSFKGLPGMLADVLPDRYGNQLMDIWLSRQGRPAGSMNPVEQLCFIGSRGMGALEFEPAQPKAPNQAVPLEIESLVEVARQMLSNREAFGKNLVAHKENTLIEILKIGTSAGGARPKAVIAFNPSSGDVRSGQGSAPAGFEHWLLKMDGVSEAQFGEGQGWGRVEYAYFLMARDCGIDMMDSKLLEEGNRAHFLTKRFDREGSHTKHHIQTLCGLQHFDYNDMFAFSYEQVFSTMRLLRLSYPEAEQMFKRMVFNVLASNCDDHTKNFSFRLKQNEKWELAPAYDLCFAYDPSNVWVNQQTLSVNGKRKNITEADLMTIAKANTIKKGAQIIREINGLVHNWELYAKRANVPNTLAKHIAANLHRL